MKATFYLILSISFLWSCRGNETATTQETVTTPVLYKEKHRPQIHFSPPSNWMNDPNGLVYYDGEYHLFYQHFPDSNVWGPMHWGHAISKDLVKWENQPIAIYPDSLGWIFSGSAVVDSKNSSGLGTAEGPPLVAMYTYHSQPIEKKGGIDYQTQGIAYSNDKGRTWKKYDGNPVIKNPGIRDFRDPKILWHEQTGKWIVALAVQDHIEFWSSVNLRDWSKLSEFGKEYGDHGGVWECPDLISLNDGSRDKWVLLVSINPGGPNGGSATQYFTGDFDGKNFKPDMAKTEKRWLDWGPDNYAGVTWFNAPGNRKIFIGWMSNWDYANVVPTYAWRSANTTPRDLSLTRIDNKLYVRSTVSPEFMKNAGPAETFPSLTIQDSLNVTREKSLDVSMAVISGEAEAKTFLLEFSNKKGQTVVLGYDEQKKIFFIDRSNSGQTSFSSGFSGRSTSPRISGSSTISFTVVTDVSSVEVFFDDGVSVMTAVFFPDEILTDLTLKAPSPVKVDKLEIRKFSPVW